VASKLTPAQILLGMHLKELGFKPEYEVRVCEDRAWRFDVICREQRLAFRCGKCKSPYWDKPRKAA
jgi:hypothetical protein